MRILKNKVWVACVGLFVVHQFIERILLLKINFLDSYLDPFLSLPILFGLILQERIWLLKRYTNKPAPTSYHFSTLEITVATLFFAFIFEEVFSSASNYFTKDYWDYLAYALGALVFYFFINKD